MLVIHRPNRKRKDRVFTIKHGIIVAGHCDVNPPICSEVTKSGDFTSTKYIYGSFSPELYGLFNDWLTESRESLGDITHEYLPNAGTLADYSEQKERKDAERQDMWDAMPPAADRPTTETGEAAYPETYMPAETAKIIRKVLKKNFPGIKFWVNSSNGLQVEYFDSPSDDAVTDLVGHYSGMGFDGMIDLAFSYDSLAHA